jgi:precorrin-6A synthase
VRKLLVIGIGAGNPDYVTMQAVKALNSADVFFIPDKGTEKEDLRRLRHEICERFITHRNFRFVPFEVVERRSESGDYRQDVQTWHSRTADQYSALLRQELGEEEVGAFLVWGDPALYDSTLRIIEAVQARGDLALDWAVIPGITSVQALAARHRVPLNAIGEPVHITTGRRLADGLDDAAGSTVVMLDGDQAFTRLGRDDLEIFWGAYLGTEDEILLSGPLSEVMGDIQRIRAEARMRKGWVMDTYLLRRRKDI